jgi:Patatin-like phospholipase
MAFGRRKRLRQPHENETARVAGKQKERDAALAAGTPPAERCDHGIRRYAKPLPRWEAMRRPKSGWAKAIVGSRPEPLPSFIGTVEDPTPSKLGICCSGGGIRSAAFNLGALQRLQEVGELERASYMTAVSGGSYIAASYAMVAKRWDPSSEERPGEQDPEHDDSDPEAIEAMKPFAKGSPEEQYLRNHSSYMAPDGSGKLYLVYRVLLGLVFNLIFISLPIFALALVLGELVYRPHLHGLLKGCDSDGGCTAHLGWWWIIPVATLGVSAALGLGGMLRRTSDLRGRFLQTWATRLLVAAGLLGLVLLAVPELIEGLRSSTVAVTRASTGAPKPAVAAIGGGAGLAGLLAGVLAYLRESIATPKKAYEELSDAGKRLRAMSKKSRQLVAYIAGGLIGPLLIAAIYVFGVSVALAHSTPHGVRWLMVWIALGAISLFVFLYAIADLTSWSLHPFYKRRLCCAFALKRIRAKDMDQEEIDRQEAIGAGVKSSRHDASPSAVKTNDSPEQVPTVATTQAQPSKDVGVAMERDYERLVPLSQTVVAGKWPTLIVCAAANVSDAGATPPGRKVTSFTFSPYSVGGPLVGAVKTSTMEKAFGRPSEGPRGKLARFGERVRRLLPLVAQTRRRRISDFSLPAAVAMSGAAISPSMGKMTKWPFRFLIAIANLRLGVWVPNPRWVSNMKKRQRRDLALFGRPRPGYLFNELIGRNRVGAKYLYVTDGGHYENLGLVELLRRGCTEIYCFDASGGEAFEVLGDAIALARSELDVSIEVQAAEFEKLFPDKTSDEAEANTVELKFTYSGGTPGRLIYARNVLTADAPWDVRAYHKVDSSFPHNTTADQLYTDQKFEAYRVLGEQAGKNAAALMKLPPAPRAQAAVEPDRTLS